MKIIILLVIFIFFCWGLLALPYLKNLQSRIYSPECSTNDTLKNFYNPPNINVTSVCKSVSGIIDDVIQKNNGDANINLKIDSQYANLIIAGNDVYHKGDFLLVVVCTFKGTNERKACGKYTNNIIVPTIGTRIAVTGRLVNDSKRGVNEIFPVYEIRESK